MNSKLDFYGASADPSAMMMVMVLRTMTVPAAPMMLRVVPAAARLLPAASVPAMPRVFTAAAASAAFILAAIIFPTSRLILLLAVLIAAIASATAPPLLTLAPAALPAAPTPAGGGSTAVPARARSGDTLCQRAHLCHIDCALTSVGDARRSELRDELLELAIDLLLRERLAVTCPIDRTGLKREGRGEPRVVLAHLGRESDPLVLADSVQHHQIFAVVVLRAPADPLPISYW